ncbi:LysR family transcriptional regulator [Pseudoalteromonas fenneropenaei]|uniref:LysR family transcriptional regulator n=1 Tax=Pseudoalteromonas fenneropenaei TaxID=1737459 RepID=A0ABV7CJ99_9GAMM
MSEQSKISLRALEAFAAFMATGSATDAANKLGLSQPAVSRLLASFEEFVGFSLFYREHGRLFPRDEALILAQEANVALSSIERLVLLAENLKTSNVGSLRIVAPVSFTSGPLADAVADFMRHYPNINVLLDSRNPEAIRELVAHRAFDCGFIQLPERHHGLVVEPLFTSQIMCALPPSHPLAQLDAIRGEDLVGVPLILLGKGRHSRDCLEQAFRSSQVKLSAKIDTHNVATACAFVKRGLGVALLNGALAAQYVDSELKLIPFTPNIAIQYGFIVSAHAPMSRLTATFLAHCQRHFAVAE